MERSDVVLQVVDCRAPLLYRCRALEQYVEESKGGAWGALGPDGLCGWAGTTGATGAEAGKVHVLLLNKADLVPAEVPAPPPPPPPRNRGVSGRATRAK